jgi:hypothetical protein
MHLHPSTIVKPDKQVFAVASGSLKSPILKVSAQVVAPDLRQNLLVADRDILNLLVERRRIKISSEDLYIR